jgi:hypothetical protein
MMDVRIGTTEERKKVGRRLRVYASLSSSFIVHDVVHFGREVPSSALAMTSFSASLGPNGCNVASQPTTLPMALTAGVRMRWRGISTSGLDIGSGGLSGIA